MRLDASAPGLEITECRGGSTQTAGGLLMAAPALAEQLTFTCPSCGDQVGRLFVDNRKDEKGRNFIGCALCISRALVLLTKAANS